MSIETIVNFERDTYKSLCEEMTSLMQLEKELAVQKLELKEKMIESSGGDRMEYGIKLQYKTVKGSIDYSKYVKNTTNDMSILEFYRKPDKEYWEIRKY